MATALDGSVIGRRFFQARRRGSGAARELTELLAADAVCVEALGSPRVIRGAEAIAEYLRERISTDNDVESLEIIKHSETDDGRIAGYWRRPSADGRGVLSGRDVITVADGRVVRLHVELLSRFG